MADASTIASLATAGGTLVLADRDVLRDAFGEPLHAHRGTRTRPQSAAAAHPAHEWEPAERITFRDEIVELRAGYAAVEQRSNGLYFAAQLRNVGAGIGVLTSWKVKGETNMDISLSEYVEPPDPTHFVLQQRSLYVPAGDVGYWQGAIRDGDTDRGDADAIRRTIEVRGVLTLFLRYADQDGGHDTITRYSIMPDDNGDWLIGIGRHWSL